MRTALFPSRIIGIGTVWRDAPTRAGKQARRWNRATAGKQLEAATMNPFLGEAVTEGTALRELADGYAAADGLAIKAAGGMFRRAGYRRLAFAGMGSSYCAPLAIIDHLATHGIPAIAPTAQRLTENRAALITADTLVVAISKSGTTQEILDLVDGIGLQAGLIALVNQPDSVLAGRCQVVLPMRAGRETQIASKSFLCTLAVLNLLAAELTGMPATEMVGQLPAPIVRSGPLGKAVEFGCKFVMELDGPRHGGI